MRPVASGWALFASLLLLAFPLSARAERGGPSELGPGEEANRRPTRSQKAARAAQSRLLAQAQRAELDSLSSLLAADPARPGRLQSAIEAAKRRHTRQELALFREFALLSGDAALAGRIEARLVWLAELEGVRR